MLVIPFAGRNVRYRRPSTKLSTIRRSFAFHAEQPIWQTLRAWLGRECGTEVILTEEDHAQLAARLARFVGEFPGREGARGGQTWL